MHGALWDEPSGCGAVPQVVRVDGDLVVEGVVADERWRRDGGGCGGDLHPGSGGGVDRNAKGHLGAVLNDVHGPDGSSISIFRRN